MCWRVRLQALEADGRVAIAWLVTLCRREGFVDTSQEDVMRFWGFAILCMAGCTEASEASEECFSNEDCASDEICVISHDHPGDDHDHGGLCESRVTGV